MAKIIRRPTGELPPMRPVDHIFAGRREAIAMGLCMRPPIGCGNGATEFDDEASLKEYEISGLCQKCQNEAFGREE
jgi:hypothetical protein